MEVYVSESAEQTLEQVTYQKRTERIVHRVKSTKSILHSVTEAAMLGLLSMGCVTLRCISLLCDVLRGVKVV